MTQLPDHQTRLDEMMKYDFEIKSEIESMTFVMGKGEVIPCWEKVFNFLAVGQKVVIQCPSFSAYGSKGLKPWIQPDIDLLFLIEVQSCEF